MGAYLSQPKTDKVSTDELSERLLVGASSMQGWRNSQEDAHNAIINFDTNTSFFAVYDGHGGAEVATYCADRLPEFLKKLNLYKNGKLEDALKEAFLEFDRTLLESDVVEVLKILAGDRNVEDSDNMEYEEDEEDLVELQEESHLPLNELLEKYKGHPSMPALSKLRSEAGGSSGSGGSKPQSPYLRGRRTAAIVAQATNKALMDPDSKPHGSSTSAAAARASACSSDASPSSSGESKSFEHHAEPLDDTTVSSSSCSSSSGSEASKTINNASSNISNSKPKQESEAANTNGAATSSSPEAATVSKPDSSHPSKESAQNGSVTSSEAKATISGEAVSSKAPADETRVSGSDDDENASAKQNGSVDSSTKDDAQKISVNKIDGADISSTTSQATKKSNDLTALSGACEDDEDDAEYQLDKSNEYSSEEDLDDNDDEDDDDDADNEEDDDNGSEAESDEFDEDADEEEDDEEAILANQQFCANMIEEPGKDSGCTAVVALLHGRDLYVANAGDSRCVVCRNGKAIDMSLDHKPEDDEESARILKAGGRVTSDGRVNGGLNLSRAIGDHAYKMNADLPLEEQMISARPDIKKLIITPEDEFMILACDGIWNFMSSDEVVDFVHTRLAKENARVSEICEELFDHCLAPDTMGDGTGCDNMTAVIVRFQPKILDLPTKINPTETEDALLKQKSEVATADDIEEDANLQKKAQKRIASPAKPDDDDDTNEAEQANNTKRLKTDIDELSPSRMEVDQSEENTKEAEQAVKNIDNCVSTAKSATENSDNVEQNECDSVVSTASIATQPPIAPAVSTT